MGAVMELASVDAIDKIGAYSTKSYACVGDLRSLHIFMSQQEFSFSRILSTPSDLKK
jgi:hypothetical protein